MNHNAMTGPEPWEPDDEYFAYLDELDAEYNAEWLADPEKQASQAMVDAGVSYGDDSDATLARAHWKLKNGKELDPGDLARLLVLTSETLGEAEPPPKTVGRKQVKFSETELIERLVDVQFYRNLLPAITGGRPSQADVVKLLGSGWRIAEVRELEKPCPGFGGRGLRFFHATAVFGWRPEGTIRRRLASLLIKAGYPDHEPIQEGGNWRLVKSAEE